MLTRHLPLALIPLSLLLLEGSALAQQRSPGFAINRFNPSERGSDWFTAESLDLRGNNRVAVGVVADYSHDSLAIYDSVSGDQVSAVISNQIYAHFGISYVIAERLRLSLDMPVLLMQQGDPNVVNGQLLQADHGVNAGDLRIGADLRLFGEYGGPITAAIGGQLYAPTGKRNAYASDGKARFAPRAMIAGEVGPFVYAARFEIQFREDYPRFDGNNEGDEGYFSAAAGIRAGAFVLGPELMGTTVLRKDAFERSTSPVELLLGAHVRVADFKIGAGFGPGLSRGIGAPDSRWLLGVEWFPEPTEAKPAVAPTPDVMPEADIDHDGIVNALDACPEKAGVANNDPAKNGCPVLDRDNDGVNDDVDACPDEAGEASGDPKTNGCPPPKDADKDGIPDGVDACPNDAGVASEDPKTNGCPKPKDTDADGIPDPEDACPAVAGVKTADPKTNGCPAAAHIEQNEIRILEPVKFAKGSDAILPESTPVLSSVEEVLQGHPEITKLEVRGHTDSRGGAGSNLTLSKKRAASVRAWLISHGIAATRLTSEGYGQTRPIDTNDTEEGRRNNRRVEFRITETAPQ